MTGTVSWEQVIAIAGWASAVIGTLIGVFVWILSRQGKMHTDNLEAYKTSVKEQQQLRHDLRSGYDQKIVGLSERIGDEARRIDQIEMFNAGLRVMLEQLEQFRADVRDRFAEVTKDRKEEIAKIDRKLDQIIQDQQRRRTEIDAAQ